MSKEGLIVIEERVELERNTSLLAQLPLDIMGEEFVPRTFEFKYIVVSPTKKMGDWLEKRCTTPNEPTNRGRPQDTDEKKDEQIYQDWKKSEFKTYADFEKANGLKPGDARTMVDRHRKRLNKGKRTTE